MKTKIHLIYIFLLTSIIYAQAQGYAKIGSNYKNTDIDKFQGTWIGAEGNDTIKIYLKKENIEILKGVRSDILIGFHYYKKSGIIVESSFDYINTNYSDKRSTLLVINQDKSNILRGTILDIKKNKTINIELIFNQNGKTVEMKLTDKEGFRIIKNNNEIGLTLPKSITLTRK